MPETPAKPPSRPRVKATPKTAAIPPQLVALGLVPPVLDATTGDPAAPGPETSYLEPEPPAYEPTPGAELEHAGDVAPAGEAASAEEPFVEEPAGSVEPAPSFAAAVGAAPAVPMSGLTGQDDAQSSKLERRLAELAPAAAVATAAEPAIGAPDVRLFDCPACGRPLERGTAKCTNCGTRLVGGRPMRRVATFAGIAVVAVLALGAVGMTALAMSPSQPATGGVPTGSAAPSPGAATAGPPSEPPTTPTGVPVAAAAALSGTGLINARISTDAGKLAATLSDATAPTVDVARAMRALAADAQQGIDLSSRLAPWTAAAPVAAKLDAFYRGLADRARDALRVSLNDARAYRSAGADLLSLVRGLAAVDAASRELATGAGISLPPLGDPGAPSAAPSS